MQRLRVVGQFALLAVASAVMVIQSCSGKPSASSYHGLEALPEQAVPRELSPAWDQLPAFPLERAASASVPLGQSASQAINTSSSAVVDGGNLRLPGGTGSLQWGLYRWSSGGDPALNLSLVRQTPVGQLFVGVANYDSGRWDIQGPLTGKNNQLDLSAANYVSPGDNVYAFVGVFSGATVTLQSLTLTIDSDVPVFTVSGRVTEGSNGLAGVNVNLSGAGIGSTVTDASGNYSFAGLVSGSYTLTPALSGYSFNPVSQAANVLGADVPSLNFSATAVASSFTVTGRVAEASNAAIPGVLVTLTPLGLSATTDAGGNYTISGVPNGAYSAAPSLTGYTFNPTSAPVNVSGVNVSGINFTGTPPATGITYETGAGEIRALLTTRCNNCHTKTFPDGGVRFDSWTEISKNSPSFPTQKVYERVLTRAVTQGNMPVGGGNPPQQPLSAAEKQKLLDWQANSFER